MIKIFITLMPKLSIERFNRKRVLLLIDKNIERKKFNAFEKIIILQKKKKGGGEGEHASSARRCGPCR